MGERDDKLRAVFEKATAWDAAEPSSRLKTDRYVPQSYRRRGGGWGVWDRREQQYVDIDVLTLAQVRDEKWTDA